MNRAFTCTTGLKRTLRPLGLMVAMSGLLLSGCATPVAGPDGFKSLDFRQVIQGAKEKVFPAVVFIKSIRESHESGKRMTTEVAGSGVIISAKGEFLTNWHVVDKTVELRCLLYDGQTFSAKVVGSDKDADLALVQLVLPAGAKPLKFARMGDSSKLKEGDFVMAMGAPWGLSRSVSMGIISCTTRHLPDISEYSLWLQTDASISPGNSGGPLVNTEGQIIGINSRGGGEMGFAIPSETLADVVPQLREFGKVNWSWTGLQLQPLKDFDKNIYYDGTEGVIVSETDPDSPARHAGILQRDRILRVGGKAVRGTWPEDLPALRRQLGLLPKFKPVEVELQRGDKILKVMLTPREKGKVEGDELDCPRWDLTVKTINQFDNPDLYFQRKKGVFIFGIKEPGNASAAGLQSQDILLKVEGKDVATLEDIRTLHKDALSNVNEKHRMVFTVLRNGLMRQIVMDFSRDYEKD